MSKVDDELTRRLRRAERPVDGEALFEGLAQRRSHRERVRRVQAGMLAFAVLAGTGLGFVTLLEAFGGRGRDVGESPVLAANGEIVFSRALPDGSEHLFAVMRGQEGERRITPVGQATYREPSISPDGQTIVMSHSIPSFEGEQGYASVIATIPFEGGAPTWLTDPVGIVQDPEWSPDGTKIAFAGAVPGAGRSGIHVMNADGSDIRLIAGSDSFDVLSPDWSPDGSRIVFTGWNDGVTQPDLYSIALDGSDLANLTETPGVDELAPAWAPDGSLIAFIAHPAGSRREGTIDFVTSQGHAAGRVSGIGDAVVVEELDWSPNGRFIAFLSVLAVTDSDTDGDLDVWTVHPNGSDLRNLTTEGASGISWRPLPTGSKPEPSPTSEPTLSPSADAAGRDIGLAFNVCNLERLGGIDFLGDGTDGTAWTGTKMESDGICHPSGDDDRYGVAVDFTGDGLADSWSGETIASCLMCAPFKATDLNGDGGDDLIVALSYFSIVQYGLYTVVPVDGKASVVPFRTGEPGHPQHALDAGEPFTFWVGGDAGISDYFYCDRLPEFWLTGTESPIDGGPEDVTTWHETHVSLTTDATAGILDARTYTVPYGTIIDHQHTTSKPDCGLGVDVRRSAP